MPNKRRKYRLLAVVHIRSSSIWSPTLEMHIIFLRNSYFGIPSTFRRVTDPNAEQLLSIRSVSRFFLWKNVDICTRTMLLTKGVPFSEKDFNNFYFIFCTKYLIEFQLVAYLILFLYHIVVKVYDGMDTSTVDIVIILIFILKKSMLY